MITRTVPAGSGLVAKVVFTEASDGDFCIHRRPADLAALRESISGSPWTWLKQVHGSEVVTVVSPGQFAGAAADAAATNTPGCVLAVHTADCAPVVVVGNGGAGVAHAGWRGIVSGVIEAVVARMSEIGVDGPYTSILGPCIRPAAYEFGSRELDLVADVAGDAVRSLTDDGRPALDLGAAVTSAVVAAGADPLVDLGLDTSGPGWFSHRTRSDAGRQATVVWIEEG